MACENQISSEDLENAKLDAITLGEVATSREGGISSGAAITQSTNRFSETTDTLQGRLNKLGVIYDDPIRNYSASLLVSDLRAHRYPADTGEVYIPTAPLPFTTGATFDTSKWALAGGVTVSDIDEILINDLSQAYEFQTALEMADSLNVFPLKKSLHVSGENDVFINYVVAAYGDAALGDIELADGQWAKKLDIFTEEVDITSASQIGTAILNGDNPTINCYGDSTMWGAIPGNLTNQDPDSPPTSLSTLIANITGQSVSINNRAISGSTIRQMLAGTDGSGSTYEDKIKPGGIDANGLLFYCNHAINDNTANDIDQYRLDLVEFVTLTRKYGKCPVIVTTNPCSSGSGSLYNEAQVKRLTLFVEAQRSVANELGVDLVDNYYWFNKTANQVPLSPSIVGDGVHLTNRAYKQSGYNLSSVLFKYKTLYKEGDSAGVYDCQYFDNLTLNRAVADQGNRTSGVLYGDKTGAQEGVNQGVIFDIPSPLFGILGAQWQGASKNELTFFNSNSTAVHYNYREFGTTATLDWDSVVKYKEQVWAGVQAFGLLVNTGDSGLGDTLTWGGVTIPTSSYIMTTDANGVVLNNDKNSLAPVDNVILHYELTPAKPLIFNDNAGGKVLEIAISATPTGQITHQTFKDGVGDAAVNIGGAASNSGFRDIQVQFSSAAITTLIDGNFAQIPLSIPLSNIVIGSLFVNATVNSL